MADLPTLERRTRFTVPGQLIFTTSLPAQLWLPRERSVGGRLVSASGLPSAYLVRRDRLVDVTLRILEEEWPGFLDCLYLLQLGMPFTWFPALDDPDGFTVTLVSPMPGAAWSPERDADYPRLFLVPLTLRGIDARPWRGFFGDE